DRQAVRRPPPPSPPLPRRCQAASSGAAPPHPGASRPAQPLSSARPHPDAGAASFRPLLLPIPAGSNAAEQGRVVDGVREGLLAMGWCGCVGEVVIAVLVGGIERRMLDGGGIGDEAVVAKGRTILRLVLPLACLLFAAPPLHIELIHEDDFASFLRSGKMRPPKTPRRCHLPLGAPGSHEKDREQPMSVRLV
ncbi:unnamed protein product, partial [Urochloa humidicola]